MKPVYALCPHCAFPAVIAAPDKHFSRYCRQCRGRYVPALAVADQRSAEAIVGERARREKHRLVSLVRRRRRAVPR